MTVAAAHDGGLDALLASLARTTLVVGKGGVGKTTCAVGIATAFARRGERTLLLSTDPAAALATVAASPIGTAAAPIAAVPGLTARQLSARELRLAFLDEWRVTIQQIIDRGTYLDQTDIDGLIDSTMPGADEVFAFLELATLIAEQADRYDRIVVDTAPTGHTVRLLRLPDTFRALVALLEAMQAKHRFMVRALTHRSARDAADDFLDRMVQRVDAFREALGDPRALAALLVARAEPTVLAETRTYAATLRDLGIAVAAVIVNAVPDDARVTDVVAALPAHRTFWLGAIQPPPVGIDRVAHLLGTVRATPPSAGARSRHVAAQPAPSSSRVDAASLVRPLTIVGGKGGVGKTTVACALAIAAADAKRDRVLLVSTDPAPSIADVFGTPGASWTTSDVEHEPADVPGLMLRQLDAASAFAALRDRYQARIDALYESIVPRGIDISADRRIMRDLLALAPPGIDELYALNVLGDELARPGTERSRFSQVVVDPAPTGHLLRLLEMPGVALEWTHRLMRLLLKYQAVVGLGDTAEDLLTFAKQTRAIDAILRDRERCGALIVALDEPVVRAEAERLTDAIAGMGIDVIGVLWNRCLGNVVPLPTTPGTAQFVADDVVPGPVGAKALRSWLHSWRRLATDGR